MFSSVTWLLIGVVMVTLEAFAIPGIGFLFGGLAALCVGFLTEFGVSETIISQAAWFCGLTILWALALWKPLKNFKTSSIGYNNIVGSKALVHTAITSVSEGKVTWSGTVMDASLSRDAGVSEISSGSKVEIVEVKGNTLYVKPIA